ncbi:MAG: DUF554 domain-containing protein [Candidatus Izemoplasmataceae bacterium]
MGTLINVIAIIIASFLGVIFKKGLPEKIQKTIMFSMGLGLSVLAIGWFLKDFLEIDGTLLLSSGDLLIIISLVVGSMIGEWIDLDGLLNRFAHGIEAKYHLPPLAKGFVSATLIFCVGAMAILGAIQDGLTGDYTILIVKSALDFVTALMLAAILGIGVIFSAISVLIYQGSIFLLARFLDDFFTVEMIRGISMVGNILLVAIGINFMELKKVKVANMLPSLLIPIIYYGVMLLF